MTYHISTNNDLSETTPQEALKVVGMETIAHYMDDDIREQVHAKGTYESDAEFIKAYLKFAPIVIG